jgi:phosphatidylserine/phosphatidylglycerophosphate/cardiolipin synthase-like enzyme
MKHKRTYLISPKWSLSSILLGIVLLLSYEAIREFSFPIIVHEKGPLQIQACFTPGQDCEDKIIKEIRKAKSEILVMCYSFTAKPIAQELEGAFRRGVPVIVISDKSQQEQKHSQIHWLRDQGVPVYNSIVKPRGLPRGFTIEL